MILCIQCVGEREQNVTIAAPDTTDSLASLYSSRATSPQSEVIYDIMYTGLGWWERTECDHSSF